METTDAPQIIEHVHESVTFTPYETRWIPCSARFVCAGVSPKGKGVMQVLELDGGKLRKVDERQKPSGIKCGTFGAHRAWIRGAWRAGITRESSPSMTWRGMTCQSGRFRLTPA